MEQKIDIRAVRSELEMSQSEFAKEVGVDQSTVSNWEKGKCSPRGPAMKVIESIRSAALFRAPTARQPVEADEVRP